MCTLYNKVFAFEIGMAEHDSEPKKQKTELGSN